MKTNIIILLLFTVIGLVSCAKESDPSLEPNTDSPSIPASEYVVSNLSMIVPTEGGDCSFSFKTSETWTASVINGRADGWLSFSPTSGQAGGVTVTLTASRNDGYEDRSATVRIVSGKNTTDLLVSQKQKDALLATSTKYEVSCEGGEIKVEVQSNVSYAYALEDCKEWIQENTSGTKALESRVLSFSVDPNTETERREGRIVFSDGSLREVVSVYQKGTPLPDKPDPRILLSAKDIAIESGGGMIKVETVSDRNVTLRIPEGYDWIQEGNSESTNTFYLTVSGNESVDSREGFVSFTDADGGFSENVNIVQMGKDAIAVAKSNYSFGLEGGSLTIEVISNKQVDAASDADWLYQDAAQSSGNKLVFTIARANAGTDRTAVITLRSGTAVQAISVRQYPQDSPISFECQAVKERLVDLFDVNGDGELSYKEAAEVTTLLNVFNEVEQVIQAGVGYDSEGNLVSRPTTSYRHLRCLVDEFAITSFDELKFFTGLIEIAPFAFYQMPYLSRITLPAGIKIIGESAFQAKLLSVYEFEEGRKGLDSIVLPEGLEAIDKKAFSGRPLAGGIVFPASLKSIGYSAFSKCYYYPKNRNDPDETVHGLKNLFLPETLEYVGSYHLDYPDSHYGGAFEGCLALESVVISNSIKCIGANDFYDCRNLKSITGSAVSRDGHAVVGYDGTLMFMIGGKMNEYIIPEGVLSIFGNNLELIYLNDGNIIPVSNSSSYSFYRYNGQGLEYLSEEEMDAYMLKSISIPASLAAPRINPFRWNNYLESFKGMGATPDGKGWVMNNCLVAVARAAEPGFNIPSSVTEIGPYAFWECKIVEMIIPDGVQKIGNSAFGGCTSLKSVSLPKGWTTIVDHMFYYCSQLEIINGIDCVEEIGRAGLSGCKALLKRFKVPSSVKKLAEASLAAEGLSIIEFQSLTPPHLYSSLVSDQNGNYSTGIFSPFGDRTTVYVPDIAYERYHSKYYGWDQIPSRKLSDLYNTPVFTLREFDEWRGSAEQHIIRITEDGKDESRYHYDFIKVESGSFERKVPDDPATTLTVNITKDFYIAETEFPQWLWLDIMHCNPSYYTDGRAGEYGYGEGESDFRPVECISWTDCNAFLSELGKLTGLNLRLPTEAEWEYAARGGKYSNGFAYSGYNSYSYQNVYFTFPCGFGVQNELGLYEMTGNVWEYCCDRYQFWGDAGTVPSGDDPIGPTDETLTNHVIRGGGFSYQGYSYYDRETGQRIEDGFIGSQANRSAVWDERSSDMVGFRPAL